jgi:hypothetical protein
MIPRATQECCRHQHPRRRLFLPSKILFNRINGRFRNSLSIEFFVGRIIHLDHRDLGIRSFEYLFHLFYYGIHPYKMPLTSVWLDELSYSWASAHPIFQSGLFVSSLGSPREPASYPSSWSEPSEVGGPIGITLFVILIIRAIFSTFCTGPLSNEMSFHP